MAIMVVVQNICHIYQNVGWMVIWEIINYQDLRKEMYTHQAFCQIINVCMYNAYECMISFSLLWECKSLMHLLDFIMGIIIKQHLQGTWWSKGQGLWTGDELGLWWVKATTSKGDFQRPFQICITFCILASYNSKQQLYAVGYVNSIMPCYHI